MKVKRLKVESFRGIEKLTLEFDPEVNVLIGINGTGKTRVLDALSIVLSRYIEWLGVSASEVRTPGDLDISNGKQGLILDVFLTDSSHWSVYKELGQPANERETEKARSKVNTVRRNLERSLSQNSKINLPILVCYSVSRTIDTVSLERLDPLVNTSSPFKQIEVYSQALSGTKTQFEEFFLWYKHREDVENEIRLDYPISRYEDDQLKSVRKAIYSFLPGFHSLRVRRTPVLRMTIDKQETPQLIINQLSGGEKCLLAMIGDIARRLAIANPGLEDPLQGEGIVLIDEIELHLHPQWQRKIIPSLTETFPNCQFIVTTHSPQVISHVKPDSIYILEATSEGIKAFRPEYSLGRDSNTILEDLMGVSSRPEKQQNDLQELFRLIEAGNLDAAREKVAQLSEEIKADDAELVSARAAIRRKEILGR